MDVRYAVIYLYILKWKARMETKRYGASNPTRKRDAAPLSVKLVSWRKPCQPVSAHTCLSALQPGHLFMAFPPFPPVFLSSSFCCFFYRSEDGRRNITETWVAQIRRLQDLSVRRRWAGWGAVNPSARTAPVKQWSASLPRCCALSVSQAVMLRWPWRMSGCALPHQLSRSLSLCARAKGPSAKSLREVKVHRSLHLPPSSCLRWCM